MVTPRLTHTLHRTQFTPFSESNRRNLPPRLQMKVFSSTHDFDYSWDEVSTANWLKYCPWNKESSHVIAVDTLSREIHPRTGIVSIIPFSQQHSQPSLTPHLQLRTERLITCRQSAPKWLKHFLGGTEVSYVYEVSHVTPLVPGPPSTTTTTSYPSSISTSNTTSTSTPPISNTTTPTRTPTTAGPTSHHQQHTPQRTPNPTVRMASQNLTWSSILRVHETVTYTPHPTDPSHKTRFEQRASITALCGGWAKVREKIEGFTVERFGQNAERGRVGFEEVLEMSRKVFGEEAEGRSVPSVGGAVV